MLKLFVFTQAFAASTVDGFRRREEGQTMAEYGVVLAGSHSLWSRRSPCWRDNLRAAFESIAGMLPG